MWRSRQFGVPVNRKRDAWTKTLSHRLFWCQPSIPAKKKIKMQLYQLLEP